MTSLLKHMRFLTKTPKATFRLAEGVIKAKLGQNRVRNCQLALTFVCNHNCEMCSSNFLLQKKQEMSLNQWCDAVDQLKGLGCTHFDLTGGEPTLKGLDFLKKLIAHITKEKDRIVSIATNAKLLDRKWLRELRKAGLNSVLFNLQSLNPKIHDKIVKDPGNLEKIKSLIPIAQEEGLNVCINTCFGTYNKEDIEELTRWCEKYNLFTLLNLAAPTGKLTGKAELRLTEFKNYYYGFLQKHPLARSDTSYNYRGPNLCPGGIEKLYITCYGDVMQCTFCQISFGNILEEPLKEIYKRFIQHPLIREKSICKHTFNKEFREKWLNPLSKVKQVPVRLKDHPNYKLYFKD